jgi:hypothetical protein
LERKEHKSVLECLKRNRRSDYNDQNRRGTLPFSDSKKRPPSWSFCSSFGVIGVFFLPLLAAVVVVPSFILSLVVLASTLVVAFLPRDLVAFFFVFSFCVFSLLCTWFLSSPNKSYDKSLVFP